MRPFGILLFYCLGLAAFSNSSRLPRPSKDHALFFAIQDYDHWTDLKNPIRDAEAIAQQLRTNYEFDDLKIVTNPTLETIQATLNQYLTKTYGPDDQLFIFFSGHGAFNDLTAEGFFIPKAGLKNDPFQNSYLPLTRLERIISNIPCAHILLTIDACYSGTFNESIALDKSDPTNPTWRRPGVDPGNGDAKLAWITAKLAKRSRICITSGGKERTSDGIEHSPLTEAFLKGLANPGDDAILTVEELVAGLKNLQPGPKNFFFGTHQTDGSFLFIQQALNNPNLDSDLDGILDTRDECPSLYAKTPSGCPDADEDGISDPKDKCPYEPGPSTNQGCPTKAADADSDGIPDVGDACPTEKGLARFAGCPDTDSDGVPDKEDNCPKQVGPASNLGCPLAPDRDRDGVPDASDRCPDQFGPASNNGCPLPSPFPTGMVLVNGGNFQMGEGLQPDETPIHQVTVSDFYLCKYEVTVGEFKQFIDATQYRTEADVRGGCDVWNGQRWEITPGVNWRCDPKGKLRPSSEYNHPVVFVSWNDASEYCKWLSKMTGKKFRLPTEAEWEYAAGNGSQHLKYSWGNDEPLDRHIGNFADEAFEAIIPNREIIKGLRDGFPFTSPVGKFEPNLLGIYDLTGNVWEWCSDWYDKYPSNPVQNPKGPSTEPPNGSKVIRGGSFDNVWFNLRIADRHIEPPIKKAPSLGFRVAYNN